MSIDGANSGENLSIEALGEEAVRGGAKIGADRTIQGGREVDVQAPGGPVQTLRMSESGWVSFVRGVVRALNLHRK